MDVLPKYIPIGGWKWKIKLVSGLKEKEGAHGDTDIENRIIRIDASVPIEEQKQILFHECLHAVLFLGGQTEDISEEKEEALVRCIENLLWPSISKIVMGK